SSPSYSTKVCTLLMSTMTHPLGLRIHFFLWLLVLASPAARSSEPASEPSWSRFRGENGTATIDECRVPIPWRESDVRWTVDLPGKGNGSPIVAGGRVFLLSADANSAERYVLCYDLKTGNLLWSENATS